MAGQGPSLGMELMRQCLTCRVVDSQIETIIKPVLEGMIAEGRPYLGITLYQAVLTARSPKVAQFNSRPKRPELYCTPDVTTLRRASRTFVDRYHLAG